MLLEDFSGTFFASFFICLPISLLVAAMISSAKKISFGLSFFYALLASILMAIQIVIILSMTFSGIFFASLFIYIPISLLVADKISSAKKINFGLAFFYAILASILMAILIVIVLFITIISGYFLIIGIMLTIIVMLVFIAIARYIFKLRNKAENYIWSGILAAILVTFSIVSYWPVYSYDCHDIASVSPDKKYRGVLCSGDYEGKLSGFHTFGDHPPIELYIFKLLNANNNVILYQDIIANPREGLDSPDYSWEWQCDQKGCYNATYEAFLDRRNVKLPPGKWHKYRAKINLW